MHFLPGLDLLTEHAKHVISLLLAERDRTGNGAALLCGALGPQVYVASGEHARPLPK